MANKKRWIVPLALVAALASAGEARATPMPATTWFPAASTNYDHSRAPIDLVVIHKAEGSAYSAAVTFQNPSRQASAHYSVGDDIVYQMVQEKDTAWHAGNYSWNQRSIGIENGGYTYRDDFTEAHYHLLAQLVANICERYRIPEDRSHIVGHSEVPDPYHPGEFGGSGHHTDPGPYFDWSHFMDLVRAYSGGSAPPPSGGGGTTPPPASGAHGVVVETATLNVRAAAWGTILGQVHQNEGFVATGAESQGFIEIWWRGQTAWVYASYTARTAHAAARVDVDTLNVRSGASLSASIVGTCHQGQVYMQFSTSGDWREIRYDDSRRWIYAAYSTGLNVGG